MSNSVDEALFSLNRLHDEALDDDDSSGKVEHHYHTVSDTLTAQQQRIEALEVALDELTSHDSWRDPGMVSIIAQSALNEATRIAQDTGQYD